jgi:uncharacterized membrane-anchored protein
MKRNMLIAAFAPVIVMAGWIVYLSTITATAPEIELPIIGFDPRDLLSGHYLRYQVKYDVEIECKASEWCVCFDAQNHVQAQDTCDAMTSCDRKLRGSCSNNRFVAGIERYYFSEKFSKELAVVPEGATITVALSSSGKGIVKALLVGGVPVNKWLETAAQAAP